MEFEVLGALTVRDHARRVVTVPPGRPARLLVGLLLRAGRRVPVGELAELLWEGDPPKSYLANLQTHVSRLRRLLPRTPIRWQVDGYRIDADPNQIDVHLFAHEIDAARDAASSGDVRLAAVSYRHALDRFAGPPLAGVRAGSFTADLARLDELRLAAEEGLLTAELVIGGHHPAVARAEALVRQHPLREPFWALLMRALAADGRVAEALDTYQRARDVLRDELGTEPGPRLAAVHRAALRGELPMATDTTPTAAPVAGGAAVPASPAVPPVCQLPPVVADFTGRGKMVADLLARLTPAARAAPPVVVVSGPPGVGKTVVAVHAAHAARRAYPDGVLFVRLSGATERSRSSADVLRDLIEGLGASVRSVPDRLDARSAAWRSSVADRRLLVVLDDAASAGQALPLLPGTPGCAVLVTSRWRLSDLPGAGLLVLEPLADDDGLVMLSRIVGPDRVAAEPAAAERVRDYCTNLPLALRIAGARLAARPDFTLSTFADRLADRRRRLDELATTDQAVRGSLHLSYVGLAPPARQILRRIAVLGARDIPARALVLLCDTDTDTDTGTGPAAAEAAVDQLISANLVEVDTAHHEPRYRLHDLLRAYALERADTEEPAGSLDEALYRLITAACCAARSANARLPRPSFDPSPPGDPAQTWPGDRPAGLLGGDLARQIRHEPRAWLRAEQRNLVAACRYAAVRGWLDQSVVLAAALNSHLWTEGRLDELAAVHRTVRAAAARHGHRRYLAWSIFMNARVASLRGELTAAVTGFRAARAQASELSMNDLVGHALSALSFYLAEGRAGDDLAVRYGRLAVAVFRRIGQRAGEAEALRVTALALNRPDRSDAALAVTDQAVPITESLDDPMALAMLLNARAGILTVAGRYADGARDSQRCVALLAGIGERVVRAYAHSQLGYLLLGLARVDDAVVQFVAALDLGVQIGDQTLILSMERNLALRLCRRGMVRQAAAEVRRCGLALRRLGNDGRAALTLRLLAELYERLGDRSAAGWARAQANRLVVADPFLDERLNLLRQLTGSDPAPGRDGTPVGPSQP
ncbi:BTAD domain-containing putative transcriptional regulator [Solwaraspora sp. WMMD937]|uniref:AfsR/SARP family transcriptional regulator n=1 Tax=Solwaraspora sp. WMMD937 TaxID=3016090 RepID=UPI00249BBC54|nr:BTAD domain-containing putative transcriptional regulator [Solwaraspora sp. WMMD937]WFE19681.1 BTAD domain-containing putative transcriptional regulator [Solwaraspora sp. WMMD937]